MNILFSGNEKVFDGVLTCALSILKRTESTEPFIFYIMTMDVPHIKPEYTAIGDKSIEFLNHVVKKYNSENRVLKLDVTELYMKEFSACPNEQCYCSPYTLLRLFIDMIPEITGKLLYLDIDIMFNRDISLLYNQDLAGFEYAAARDHYGKFLLNPNYINAGVLLFNMEEVRKTGLLEKARHETNPEKRKAIYWEFEKVYSETPGVVVVAYLDGNYVSIAGLDGHDTTRVLGHHAVGVMWNIEEWTLSK